MPNQLKNWKLTLCYDGSAYQGWQRLGQSEGKTVQGELEKTLSLVLGEPIRVTGAGRTDAGVHAAGQTANFHTRKQLSGDRLREEGNRRLPPDIKIRAVELVPNRFHSRYDAKGKTYEYRLETGERPCVFRRRYAAFAPGAYSMKAMREAAGLLAGTHDFKSFSHAAGEERGTIKTIKRIEIEKEGETLLFRITGDGFLYHMVRLIAGTLMETGLGKRPASDMVFLLERGERGLSGPLLPARGLFLQKIYY